ncbi:MAG: serine/threonine-protein kinase [Gaiellales bacterium]
MAVHRGVLPERYANARRIGHGGMGEILLAEDRELGRKVAVKLLDERFARDDALRRRFRREALAAARLSGHPHVVTIFDVGEWRDRPFIVMEYLPGGTLAERARAGSVPRDQALMWLEQAAAALDAAHAEGIVHRDVKPANLLLDSRDELQVADFGIARVVDDSTGSMTAAGTVLGTAGYLAPEQARGEEATPASDRYALGVVAYELLTGGRPFERGSATAEAVAHIHEEVPPASERGVGLPRQVDDVFERALAKDPARRYRSAAEFLEALQAALNTSTESTRILPASLAPPPASRRRGWSPVPIIAGVLLAGLTAGILAAAVTTGGEDPQGATEPRQVTITQVETRGGTTVEEVVTTTVQAPATSPGNEGEGDAAALTDEATAQLERGDWEEALRLMEQALPPLQGTYSDDFRYEAYAEYNIGKALAELGRCDEALPHLERSEELQGTRGPITSAKQTCE